MKIKIKGFNLTKKILPSIPKKQLIKEWKVFPGDTVLVTRGKEEGKTGKILSIVHHLNSVTIQGLNMKIKHVKPNPDSPKGSRITMEGPIPVSCISLLDPTNNEPTPVKLGKIYNPTTKNMDLVRISELSNSYIKVPEKPDKWADQAESKLLDTPVEAIERVSWTPSNLQAPFPVPLLNELEKFKRFNKESHVF
jgi:large subunit ribosomal protein L24